MIACRSQASTPRDGAAAGGSGGAAGAIGGGHFGRHSGLMMPCKVHPSATR